MLRFAANLSLLFTEVPLVERFQRAADAGFRLVEIMFPDVPEAQLAAAIQKAGVTLLQFNVPAGSFAAGDRGLLALPDKREEFRSAVESSMGFAKRFGVRQVNCLAGNWSPAYSPDQQMACVRENLAWASPLLESAGVTMNIEPLSPFQSPKYVFPRSRELFPFLKEIGLSRIGVQYDVFHAQLTEGNLVATMKQIQPLLGHIQIADAPDRHQPGTGEINYRYVFSAIEAMGYEKVVSLEYVPQGTTEESLAWLPRECRVEGTAADLRL